MSPEERARVLVVATTVRDGLLHARKQGWGDAPFWDPDLGGACATGSAVLARMLRRRGFDVALVAGEFRRAPHCWVEFDHDTLIDVTATQFGIEDPVYWPSARPPEYRTLRTSRALRYTRYLLEDFGVIWATEGRPIEVWCEREMVVRWLPAEHQELLSELLPSGLHLVSPGS